MSRNAFARAALALTLSLSPSEAANPVEGGLSSRLAPLQSSLARGKAAFAGDLASTLERSRNEVHELIDQLAATGDLAAWLEAMSVDEAGNLRPGFATELKGASPEQVKAALHSRVERKLSGMGREIQASLDREDEGRLEASFLLALNDLGREEGNLVGSLDDGDDADVDAPAAPSDAPAGPRGSWDHQGRGDRRDGRFDGRFDGRRDGRFDGGHPGRGRFAREAAIRARMEAERRAQAWMARQRAAAEWNRRAARFERWTYTRGARLSSRPFPAGAYYRPDRVERVVKRGLWGVATVAATPFALLASLF